MKRNKWIQNKRISKRYVPPGPDHKESNLCDRCDEIKDDVDYYPDSFTRDNILMCPECRRKENNNYNSNIPFRRRPS